MTYLALNCRRRALGSTSTSGMVSVCVWVIVRLLCSALYSNFQGGHCLTHVGTEGPPRTAHDLGVVPLSPSSTFADLNSGTTPLGTGSICIAISSQVNQARLPEAQAAVKKKSPISVRPDRIALLSEQRQPS